MPGQFHTLLLLALPASGKSEVRTFLTAVDPARFHMGDTVQLDDYPYVHLQLRIDDELAALGCERPYHAYKGGPFKDPHEWGGLARLVDEDYHELLSGKAERPADAARRLFARFDKASVAAGGKPKFDALPAATRDALAQAIEEEAQQLFADKAAICPATLDGKTIVIEFARGGPADKGLPLPEGYGYAGSLPHLSPTLLSHAAILYIWVTPEESRRKNRARARPDGDGSILFHGTPEVVMHGEYGCDDMEYLLGNARREGTIFVESGGQAFDVPTERLDNRQDKTSFLRGEPAEWPAEEVKVLSAELEKACERLFEKVKG
jgi:hypothetical protein